MIHWVAELGRQRNLSFTESSKHIPVNSSQNISVLSKIALLSIRGLLQQQKSVKMTPTLTMGLNANNNCEMSLECFSLCPKMSWVRQPGCTWCCHPTCAPDWLCNISIWLMIHRGSLSLSLMLSLQHVFSPWRALTLVNLGNSHSSFSELLHSLLISCNINAV